jgi:phospholipase C
MGNNLKHVIILMQENRSFDEYFGTFPGARGFSDPTGVFTNQYLNDILPFRMSTFSTSGLEVDGVGHDWNAFHVLAQGNPNGWSASAQNPPSVIGYYTANDLPFHWSLASNFMLCDQYYASVLGGTFANRLYLMSGQLGGAATGTPPGNPGTFSTVPAWPTYPEMLPQDPTVWKIYDDYNNPAYLPDAPSPQNGFGSLNVLRQFASWSTYSNSALVPVNGTQQLLADFEQHALPTVCWIIPTFGATEWENNHPSDGAAYIAKILDYLLTYTDSAGNPYWDSTALVICYDEAGGHFDHASLSTLVPPTQGEAGYEADEWIDVPSVGPQNIGPGFRVPAIIVSPWTFGEGVNSRPFDHTSTLKLLQSVTGVAPSLGDWRNQTFGNLHDVFNFNKQASVADVRNSLSWLTGNTASITDAAGVLATCAFNRLKPFLPNPSSPPWPGNTPPKGTIKPPPNQTIWQPPVAPGCEVIVTVPSYSRSDVIFNAGSSGTSIYNPALLVIVDGFEPLELAMPQFGNPPNPNTQYVLTPTQTLPLTSNSNHQCTTRVPAITFTDDAGNNIPGLTATPVSIDQDPGDPSLQTFPGVPSTFTFTFNLQFADNFRPTDQSNIFPSASGAISRISVNASFAVDTVVTSAAELELLSTDDPQFYHNFYEGIDYLSGELRVFSIPAGAKLFGVPLGNTAGASRSDAYTFITAVIDKLNGGGQIETDPLQVGNTVISVASFDDLPQDEDTNPLQLSPTRNGIPFFNFALARVHMTAQTDANNVRVFFRSFRASVTTSQFDPVNDFATVSQFRSNPPAAQTIGEQDTRIPLLGVIDVATAPGLWAPEYVTIPFFASERAPFLSPPQPMKAQTDTPNVRTIAGNMKDTPSATYFGCWLDINQPNDSLFPQAPVPGNWDGPWPGQMLFPIQRAFKSDLHQCLVAEISFFQFTIPTGDNPATSAWLAQRNLGLVQS